MKPRHRAALLIVGMFCVLFYLKGRFEHLFLIYGLMVVYGYKGGAEEMERIIGWQRGVRLKSLYFYGAVVLFFLLSLLLGRAQVPVTI